MSSFGILGYGAHIPRTRISRTAIFDAVGWAQPALKAYAKGARAFAAWDEDAITMGVEAARGALADSGVPDALAFASTTAPFLDRQNAGVIAAALDLPPATHCYDFAGSQRAGLSAILPLVQERSARTLVVASDKRPVKAASALEMLAGDGAAAMLVGAGAPLAVIEGVNAVYGDFVDHYRTAASGVDYALEERWYREAGLGTLAPAAIGPLLERCGLRAEAVDRFIAPLANPALARAVAEAAGVRPDALADPLFDDCGHTGCAHPLLMLAAALDSAGPGEKILVAAFGQGCDAMLLTATDRLADAPARGAALQALARRRTEENYARFLAAGARLDIDYGMRAERDNRTAQTVAFNKSRDVYGFVGGECAACGAAQFPKSRRCVNPDCAALDTQKDHRFADRTGTIKTYTEDWLAFTRSPPLVYGNVSFEGGGNVFMEMTDFAPGEAAVGGRVAMRFRIKDIDGPRGFHRYFWKAAPADGGADG